MVARSRLPTPTSVRKSVQDAPATASVTNPPKCQGIRVRTAGSVSLASCPSSKPAAARAPGKVLILGQSTEFPVEIPSSRELSPVDSSSSWVNLDSDSSRPSGSGVVQVPQEASLQEKLKTLEQTVASLQAQLQAPQSSLPKVTAFNAIVDLVKDAFQTEILVYYGVI